MKKKRSKTPRTNTSKRKASFHTHSHKGKAQLRQMVLSLFRDNKESTFHAREVAMHLGAADALAFDLVEEVLEELTLERALKRGRHQGSYLFSPKSNILRGLFQRKSGRGDNSFLPEDGGDPINVSERDSKHALDGDRVEISLLAARRGQAPSGEVIRIIERADNKFVGKVVREKGLSFLVTDSNKLSNDIIIPERYLSGAEDGEKVVVRILEWPSGAKNPVGEVIEIIGMHGDNDTEMHAILAEFGLPYRYPKEVEEYASHLDEQTAFASEYEREDFREIITFTIDPVDAKDFDDALSLRKLESNHWEVGVHIADVTSYIQEGDIIDQEAAQRGTSVYLVDRTIPMLPERLCNDLCSLRQGVDRPAYSVIFEMDEEARILSSRITRTVINSDRRFTYEEAQAIIEGETGEYQEEILRLNSLSQKLRAKRFKEGSIDFNRSELHFIIDEKGKPIDAFIKQSKEANKLIEEFMLLANQAVATYIHQQSREKNKELPFVYRVHDAPTEEKLRELSEFVFKLGYKLNYRGSMWDVASEINSLLKKIKGTPEENMLEVLTIRSMAKAVYQTENIGHFGLGFENYTHFTSPIRRHPDMMVHRLLTHYIKGGKPVNKEELSSICQHDSNQERLASDAERTSIKYKEVEYLQEYIGVEFSGMISGVKEFGIFVQLDNGCEGMVPIRCLDDDYYYFDEKSYALIGFNKKKRYALGQPIQIRVTKADLNRRQVDFELADEER